MKRLVRRAVYWLVDWVDEWLPACPQCGSEVVRENGSSPVLGSMLCDDCGCRWRP